jgi:hypothetical protein
VRRSDLTLGVIVLGALLGLTCSYLMGAWWSGGEAYYTVSEAMARHQGTGSLAGMGRTVAAVSVYIACAAIPVLPAFMLGASSTRRRRLPLAVLVVTVTATSILGFTLAASMGGRALVSDAWLHDGYEEYSGRVRQADDLPPLSDEEAARLVIPDFLADEATPATSPLVGGPFSLLVAVTLGGLVGYGIGSIYRPRRAKRDARG